MKLPVLLTVAGYYGTLAAARRLGRAGIPVVIADDAPLAPARWSRYVSHRPVCPSVYEPERFIEWLLEYGRRRGRHVLLPTSDDVAWLFSRYRDALSERFALFQPSVDVLYGLLNKKRLHAHCAAAEVATPATWFPDSLAEVDACLSQARLPLLVKPRTQVLFPAHSKGARVELPQELRPAYERVSRLTHADLLLRYDPDAGKPMLQQYHPEAAERIYNLSGFAGPGGEIWALRGGRKVLQRPRRIGIGLCFEEAAVEVSAAEALSRLLGRTGFYGAFEAEFIMSGTAPLLIDFNPRFYNQMAFDEDRGLPLAALMYYSAIADETALATLRAAAATVPAGPPRIYTHRFSLELMLTLQSLSGALSREEARAWRQWRHKHRRQQTDAVLDWSDPVPAAVDIATHVYGYLRHPRSAYRTLIRNL